ncbi:uncharacterized protein LOC127104904 [Lathyrus oleraceus]|uniref:uncharacterized protein LOC127104904 n=1 Tax=Pisum sativum TaxID=3888 RepID=UPI0021D2B2F2|nr:uncharacterized protein LOC127104904 [Pisum sativum]
MNESNPELPHYIKPPYLILKKKPKKETKVRQFNKFMDMLTKIQINIPFCEALEHMHVYAKFMKEILLRKIKLKHDENIVLAEECSAIIQRKLPLKLTDLGRFTIMCSIGSLRIGHALFDLGASINLMSLSMMRKLNYGESKPTKMTLALVDQSITCPYGVLEDVLVRVDELLFPVDFVILNMHEDSETPLILGRPFLEMGRDLIDVELRELILRFNKEKIVFNVFEAMKRQKENPQCYRIDMMKEKLKRYPYENIVKR